jgi:alkylated DNA repair dioxygenase AlkB
MLFNYSSIVTTIISKMNTIIHTPLFLENSEELFNIILQNTEWTKINYFKRHVSHYGFNIPKLNVILLDIEKQFSRKVIGTFLNYYENGNEYAPYHADKYNCDTCLISLGTTRTLRYKSNETKENVDFILNSGDLLFLPNETNNNYKHSLLKTTKVNKPRISILAFLQ